jgi:methyltransferase (TIGR00027 family)
MPSSVQSTGFGPGQPSRTSITVAALRAFGAREPDPAVRNPDSLAERLLGPAQLALIKDHPVVAALEQDYQEARKNREVSGMANLLLIRTRFIDDHLQRAIQNGSSQVVILGAGFDTRAYRFADLLKNKIIIEVDYQSTQEIKRQRLKEASISIPQNVRFAQIDFQREKLPDVLRTAGYKPGERTFFIWEGVSMYLSENAVRETLRTIAQTSESESSLVMDFAESSMLDLLAKFPKLPQHKYTTAWGEPWIFGLPDLRESEFFKECGLELREVLSFFGRDAVKRYLTRADGTSLGPVRGGSPQSLWMVPRLLWMFLTRRSKWYAVGHLTVS